MGVGTFLLTAGGKWSQSLLLLLLFKEVQVQGDISWLVAGLGIFIGNGST